MPPPPPVFDRSINPIRTRGTDYPHHITYYRPPPRFLDGASSLSMDKFFAQTTRFISDTKYDVNQLIHLTGRIFQTFQ